MRESTRSAQPSVLEPAGAKAATIVALGLAVTVLEGYDIQAMGVAAPRLIPLLDFSKQQAAWVFAASMIGLVLGALGGGWLADRLGRRPVLLQSVITFGLFSFATLIVHDFSSMFLVRLLTGIGLGGAMPNLIAVANEASRKERRTLTTAMMFSGMPFGGACAALVAQFGAQLDWRVIFLVGGALPIAIAPLIYWLWPETGRRGGDHMGARAMLRHLLGREQAAVTLLLWLGLVLTLIVTYLLLNWLPLLAAAKGVDAADASISSVTFNIGSIPGALILGAAVDRRGLRSVMLLSFGGATMALVALAAARGDVAIAVLCGVAGFGVVGNLYAIYGVVPVFYPAAMRATASGAAVAVGRVGSILGPLVAGELLTLGFSAGAVVLVLAPMIAVSGAAIVALTYLRRVEAL